MLRQLELVCLQPLLREKTSPPRREAHAYHNERKPGHSHRDPGQPNMLLFLIHIFWPWDNTEHCLA